MSAFLVAVSAFVAIMGVVAAVYAVRFGTTRTRRKSRVTELSQFQLGVLVVSVLLAVLTRWLPMLLLVPGLTFVLPKLLRDPKNREIEILQALDRWIRLLAASVSTGKTVTDAMRATFSQCPELIKEPVSVMLSRLNHRWPTREALFAMADELDSADADVVLAALILLSERGGIGARTSLQTLSETIAARLHALREIEAERSKPRIVVRQVTAITLFMIVGTALISGDYFRPFTTVVGQLIACVLIVAYLGALAGLQRMSAPRKRDRILVREHSYV